jgi:hypothetical protein
MIDEAIGTADPVLCNLRVTLAHRELSQALHERLGPDSGANFHTWAVWGSKKAGRTIRRQDVPALPPAAAATGGAAGVAAGALAVRGGRGHPAVVAATATAGAVAALGQAQRGLRTAAEQILEGNITVLDDIGRVTARFVDAFPRGEPPAADAVEDFVAPLRAGPPSERGQDLLRLAFTDYAAAWREGEERLRAQRMLLANLNAILHEHERLEPYIDGAVPRALRRLITARLLDFRVGSEDLSVHDDVPRLEEGRRYARGLTQIDNPELFLFLNGPAGWDRTRDTLTGSAAGDWTQLRDRMNFICDLFRSRQFDPGLFAAPYDDGQVTAIRAGHVPDGAL